MSRSRLTNRKIFQRWLVGLVGLILILLTTRLISLGHRGFHHDESLHAYYSWLIARDGTQVYQYNPVYHGPFLYHSGALMRQLLPDTDYAARLPFALAGVAGILLFLAWRRWLGLLGCLALMGLMTCSPLLNYYARFARNDIYMIFWMTGEVVAGSLYLATARKRYLFPLVFCIILSYCTKENFYIHHFALGSYLLLLILWRGLIGRREVLRDVFVRYLPPPNAADDADAFVPDLCLRFCGHR